MKNVEQISHKGKTITVVNIAGSNPSTMPAILAEAQAFITAMPPKSVLSLTDATGCTFNKDSAGLLKIYSEKIIPNVKASCVVGADALRSVLLASVAQHVKKEIKSFSTRTEAMDWLSSQ